MISLHVYTPTGNIGSFYQLGKTDSMVFAETISEELGTSTYVGDFAILRDTTVNSPKTLIETARINAASIHLPSFEENIATSIVSGLKKYFA